METTVVNCRRIERWDWCDSHVYIGRGSRWGNPFIIGRDGTREEVIEKYRAWVVQQEDIVSSLQELYGKVLVCYCKPLPCHGDVLVELLNRRMSDVSEEVDEVREEEQEQTAG